MNKSYPHQGECKCGNKHMCKVDCSYKEKSDGCEGICNLEYGHDKKKEEEIHNCGVKHYCINDCFYKNKAKNCKENGKCISEYGHEGNCSCGAEHLCEKKCLIDNCLKDCKLPYNHKDVCDCKKIHYCKKDCHLLKYSTENSCNKKCVDLYGHEKECKCKLPPEKHKCNKKCSSHSFFDSSNSIRLLPQTGLNHSQRTVHGIFRH